MSNEDERDARTVFVRNVAFDVDQPQLEQAFADIGPVRSAFLVTQKGQQRHKGVAFVQYAIPEDADRAVEELNGKELNGRKLKIEHARKRAPLAERKQRKRSAEDGQIQDQDAPESAPQAAAAAAPSQPAKKHKPDHSSKQQPQHSADKHKWVRTVALGGLKPEFKPHASRIAAAAGSIVEIMDPPPADVAARAHLQQDGCSGEVVFVVYDSVKEATSAVKQLHNKTITAADITAAAAASTTAAGANSKKHRKEDKKAAKAAAKQQQESAAAVAVDADDSVVLWARVVSGEGALVKKWRLILRNLPWQATEADIYKLLSATDTYAWQVQIPKGSDGRSRGFAFVSFMSYPEAEKALQAANGQLVRKRPVAADWAVSKGQYQELKSQTPAAAAAAAAGDHDDQQGSKESNDGSDLDQGSEGSDDLGSSGFSDSEDLDQGSSEESDGDHDDPDHDDEADLSSDDDGDDDDDHGSLDGRSDESEGSEGEESEEFEHDREVTAHALDAVLSGVTQQQQQQQQEPQAGAVDRQKDKGDKQQQKSAADDAGQEVDHAAADRAVARTVFVRGISTDTTSQELQARFDRFGAVKACRLVINKSTSKPKGTAFIEFRDPAGAAAAAAACARARSGKGPEILVKGVKLDVDLALTGDDARKLGQSLTGDGSKGSGGKFDRRNMYLAKEGFIEEGSQQWMNMSDNDRRKRKRAAEEKNEKLKSPNFAVSTTRLAVRNIPSSWDERKLKAVFIEGVKQRATKEKPEVKQVKILRDPERSDPGGHPGGKSRGFGFVEFSDHSHALAALRQLNNNPTAFGSAERRPIVEFACDNVKILKARESKLAKQKLLQQQKKEQRQQQQRDGESADMPVGGQDEAMTDGQPGPQQQQQQQQEQGDGAVSEKLSKRQIKRRKEKEKKLKRQEQQQQQNGTAAAAAGSDKRANNQQQKQQRQKKGTAATAAASAAAEAKAARTVAKSKRQQQQAAAEEAVRSKKRQVDDELDRLATAAEDANARKQHRKQQQQQQGKGAAAAAAGDDGRKRHKPGRAQEDRLEQMVQDYKAKLFGLGSSAAAGGAGSNKQQQQRQGIKGSRWFD